MESINEKKKMRRKGQENENCGKNTNIRGKYREVSSKKKGQEGIVIKE